MNPQSGDVWLADLGLAAKTRPDEVALPRVAFLDRDSIANVQGVGSLPRVRLERRLGKLPDEVMTKIKRALDLGIDT